MNDPWPHRPDRPDDYRRSCRPPVPNPRSEPRPWPPGPHPTGPTHPAGPAAPTGPAADESCPRCRTWLSCCFCAAEPEAMRDVLRRIAELHSGCAADLCPERARLATLRPGH